MKPAILVQYLLPHRLLPRHRLLQTSSIQHLQVKRLLVELLLVERLLHERSNLAAISATFNLRLHDLHDLTHECSTGCPAATDFSNCSRNDRGNLIRTHLLRQILGDDL